MRALLLWASALLLFLGPAAQSQVPDTGALALTADSEERWVDFTYTAGNQMRFTAELDGAPVSAVLDTGASVTTLSRAYAERTKRRIVARGQAYAIGGAVAIGSTSAALLRFGGLTRAGGSLAVAALPGAVTGHDEPVDLLVGRDLLDRFALDIDPDTRRFRLLPSGRLPFSGTRVPLTVGGSPRAYLGEATVAGQRVRPMVIDTGDGTDLTLRRSTWRRLPFDREPPSTSQLAQGVGGPIEAQVVRLNGVAIGGAALGEVTIWVEPTGGLSDVVGAAGRIGMGVLGRYRLLLDPRAGHMILRPAATQRLAVRSTSGLQLVRSGDRLRVLHVMRASPAAAAGWRRGETICAVDGVAVGADAAQPAWPSGAPGTVVLLDLCDGTRRSLTLRDFY